MLIYVIVSFLISFISCFLIIKVCKRKKSLITDHVHDGIQSFHKNPTPRLGGAGLFLAFMVTVALVLYRGEGYKLIYAFVFLASIPAFLSGLIEDVTGKLYPKIRMLFIVISGVLAFFLAGAVVVRVDVPYVDALFQFQLVSFIFSLIALAGLTNAVNIIDGFNGLASMVSIMILLSISFVAYKLGDYFIVTSCVVMAGALAGFFILNYPYGLIFLGDGGAYFTGFFIAIMSILLVKRHPEVSAWFAVLVNIYPIYETLFSIYRKKLLRKRSAMSPDGLHFHMLFYKVIVKRLLGTDNPIYRNPATSPFMWMINLLGVLPALLFWRSTALCVVFSLIFILIYTSVYWSIIYKRMPRRKSKC